MDSGTIDFYLYYFWIYYDLLVTQEGKNIVYTE